MAADVLAALPAGLAVVEADGRVAWTNTQFERLLDLSPAGARSTCCALLGCGTRGTGLARGCVARLALAANGPLPEIRVELESDSGLDAVWVVAAPMPGSPNRVLLHLRPAEHQGARGLRESDSATVRIRTLGECRVETADGAVSRAWLAQRPGQLLKLLIAERRRMLHAEEIAEALSPDGRSCALGNVRQFVHALREELEPTRSPRDPSAFVIGSAGRYSIDVDHVWIDADEFEDSAEMGFAAAARGEREPAIANLERAAALYGGDFLADEPYSEWAFPERERLRQIATRVLRDLSHLYERAGDLDAAATNAARLAEVEPYDAGAQRHLIALCLRRGRRSEALRRYRALRVRMMRDFDEELDFELCDLVAS